MEPEGSLPVSQKPATVPILSQIDPVHAHPPHNPTSRIMYINYWNLEVL
jgi:hypothetical protein